MGERMMRKELKVIAAMLFVTGVAWAADVAPVEAAPWWVDKLLHLTPWAVAFFVLAKPAHAFSVWLRADAAKNEAGSPIEAKVERGVATIADIAQEFVDANQHDFRDLASDPEKRAAAEKHLENVGKIELSRLIDAAVAAPAPTPPEVKS